jgi:response regulator RpfG family c-di-GMP phosphodiesterase
MFMSKDVTILYVDDEPVNVFLFSEMFGKKYTVLTADSGIQGLDVLKQHGNVKILISDMRMPGMNGLEFIEEAKGLMPSVICCILTGYDITPEIKKALQEGLIVKYFQKPFNMKEIDSSIYELLN